MKNKMTKHALATKIRKFVDEQKEWFDSVKRNQNTTDESLALFFNREANELLDVLIWCSNRIEHDLK